MTNLIIKTIICLVLFLLPAKVIFMILGALTYVIFY